MTLRWIWTALLVVVAFAAPPAHAQQGSDWTPAYYMDSPAFCTEVKPGSALAANPIVKPYVDASAGTRVMVKECDYTFASIRHGKPDRHGWVVLADPPADLLVAWVRAACLKAVARVADKCVSALLENINNQSGGQFPILGFVAEGEDNCTQDGNVRGKTGLIAFQDGVTVQLKDANGAKKADYCMIEDIDVATQKTMALTRQLFDIFHIARLAGLRDSCAPSLLTPELVAEATALGLKSPWLLVSRRNHIAAMTTGVDRLLETQARRFAFGIDGSTFSSGCPVDPDTIILPK